MNVNKITRNNYESWFLDHLEGRLNKQQTIELHQFLSVHTDLQQILNDYEDVSLTPESFSFNEKESLKHVLPVNESNFDHYAISHYEKLLSSSDEKDLQEYLSLNPRKVREFALYERTYLAEEKIFFKHKASLKRHALVSPVKLLSYSGIAASIVIVFFIMLANPFHKNKENIAVNAERVIKGEITKKLKNQDEINYLKSSESKKSLGFSMKKNKEMLKAVAVTVNYDTPLNKPNPVILPVSGLPFKKSLAINISSQATVLENVPYVSQSNHSSHTLLNPIYESLKLISADIRSSIKYEKHVDSKNHREYVKLETKFFGYSRTIAGE